MAKSFYQLPKRDIKAAVETLIEGGNIIEADIGFLFHDFKLLKSYTGELPKSICAMHRNDFLVKSNEYWLKENILINIPAHCTICL